MEGFITSGRLPTHLLRSSRSSLEQTPLFPERARRSREHYPRIDKGQTTTWEGRRRTEIILDDNSRAQMAWERYTGEQTGPAVGYGVDISGETPTTPMRSPLAGNLCYMPFWAGMLTEDQHPLPELQTAIRQLRGISIFLSPQCARAPTSWSDPGIDLPALLDGTPLMVLYRDSKGAAPETAPQRQREPRGRRHTLPITLEPPKAEDFLDALLRTKKAWIEISYQAGRKEVQPWNAGNMGPTSNVIGNLRSRPEFRSDAWQKYGITSVRVTIEEPAKDKFTNTEDIQPTGWRRQLAQFFSRRDSGKQ